MDLINEQLPKFQKEITTTVDQICVNGTKNCRYMKSTSMIHIEEPFPEILHMNVNWWDSKISAFDCLKFALSIPRRFMIQKLFNDIQNGETEYVLKAIVVFLGAHYMTFVK